MRSELIVVGGTAVAMRLKIAECSLSLHSTANSVQAEIFIFSMNFLDAYLPGRTSWNRLIMILVPQL